MPRVCSLCGPLLAEVEAGKNWLTRLEEVEPPANLVHNILVATSGVESTQAQVEGRAAHSWMDAVREWLRPVVVPAFAVMRQPRFVMSFGMAFFSLSIALSMAGVKVSDLRNVDLRPSAIKRSYYETSGRVVKYYDNIRFVYEIESRVREFKRVATPAEQPEQQPRKDNNRKNNDTSGQPDQKQERNYSQGENQPVMAASPSDLPVVTVTTYRRLV